ncbi:hypothetical protein PYW08_010392 [Mythimna loreyi]|uniref:Uncharacterized protein n=1 Tax=Mythimna loreyi TaxID=667449 RepID=A0ACC2Q696_9NEOP|nr:hypothetical protein PYW08_010392 [Mythimna loreyi]
MYVIVLGIFIIKLQISISDPQFPTHVDLQKVGEAIFDNERFNILKPATHVITDHFKEFMLRRGSESSNHPAKRVFLDKNGFRHEWSGFGEEIKSLRKTDLKYLRGSFEVDSENTPKPSITTANKNVNTIDTDKDSSKNKETEDVPGYHHHHHQPFNVPTAGTQASSLGEGMGHNPPHGPSAVWWMSQVYEFLRHAGFLTMFSFTDLRAVEMNKVMRLAGFEPTTYNS